MTCGVRVKCLCRLSIDHHENSVFYVPQRAERTVVSVLWLYVICILPKLQTTYSYKKKHPHTCYCWSNSDSATLDLIYGNGQERLSWTVLYCMYSVTGKECSKFSNGKFWVFFSVNLVEILHATQWSGSLVNIGQ